jgi:hypothetical protein
MHIGLGELLLRVNSRPTLVDRYTPSDRDEASREDDRRGRLTRSPTERGEVGEQLHHLKYSSLAGGTGHPPAPDPTRLETGGRRREPERTPINSPGRSRSRRPDETGRPIATQLNDMIRMYSRRQSTLFQDRTTVSEDREFVGDKATDERRHNQGQNTQPLGKMYGLGEKHPSYHMLIGYVSRLPFISADAGAVRMDTEIRSFERREIQVVQTVTNARQCQGCHSNNHLQFECPARPVCQVCGKGHHISRCETQFVRLRGRHRPIRLSEPGVLLELRNGHRANEDQIDSHRAYEGQIDSYRPTARTTDSDAKHSSSQTVRVPKGNERKDSEVERLKTELALETRRRKEGEIEILKLQLALKELRLRVEGEDRDGDGAKTHNANKRARRG